MSKKLEKIGNFFVMTDTVTGNEDINEPSSKISFSSSSSEIFLYKTVKTWIPIGEKNGYTLSEVVDSEGSPFASIDAVKEWLRSNVGSGGTSTSSGDGEYTQEDIDWIEANTNGGPPSIFYSNVNTSAGSSGSDSGSSFATPAQSYRVKSGSSLPTGFSLNTTTGLLSWSIDSEASADSGSFIIEGVNVFGVGEATVFYDIQASGGGDIVPALLVSNSNNPDYDGFYTPEPVYGTKTSIGDKFVEDSNYNIWAKSNGSGGFYVVIYDNELVNKWYMIETTDDPATWTDGSSLNITDTYPEVLTVSSQVVSNGKNGPQAGADVSYF